jgi:hypothetical protein
MFNRTGGEYYGGLLIEAPKVGEIAFAFYLEDILIVVLAG